MNMQGTSYQIEEFADHVYIGSAFFYDEQTARDYAVNNTYNAERHAELFRIVWDGITDMPISEDVERGVYTQGLGWH